MDIRTLKKFEQNIVLRTLELKVKSVLFRNKIEKKFFIIIFLRTNNKMLYTKHFAEQLAQHATSFWINKREETGGSAGYKIENYIEENDAFLQHYVDMEYEEETAIYNGIELPRFVDGREVISYPNAGLG
jgi:hypothetical protein